MKHFEEEHPIVDWIRHYGQPLLYGMIALVAVIVAGVVLFGPKTSGQIDDYLLAEKDFSQVQNLSLQIASPEQWKEQFSRLQVLIARLPDLHSKYDAPLAETLIMKELPSDAAPFVQRTFKRTEPNHLPLYTSFAKTTLLIDEQKYQEALTEAEELQQQMSLFAEHNEVKERQREYGPLLFGYNLLRIASLQQKLGQHDKEKETWNQFNTWLSSSSVSKILENFREGNASLPQYIESRKQPSAI